MTIWRQPPVWSPLDLRAILAGVRAAWLGGGARARSVLEGLLREKYSPAELYLTDSGTSALTLALLVVRAATRAPVALPAYCCYDVATAADGAEIPFFLYDVDPRTLSPDFESLRETFKAGARSAVVAHLFGVPADLARVQEVAAPYQALVIEDAAQGSGCDYRGNPAGSLGALGVLSFGRGKGVTGGSGGALLLNDGRLAEALKQRQWRGIDLDRSPRGGVGALVRILAQWLLARPGWYAAPAALPFLQLGETIYRNPHPISGMIAFAAGVLTRTLVLAPGEIDARRRRASVLGERGHQGLQTWPIPDGWTAGWLRYPVVLPDTATTSLSHDLVVDGVARGYPLSLAVLGGFGGRRLNPSTGFPGASRLADRLVTVPTHRFVRGAKMPAF